MSKREHISRYNLIINRLRKSPADFKAVSECLAQESEMQEYNFEVSRRTFQRDRDDIRSLFNIDIQYDFSRKVYFIDDAGQPEVNDRILEAFDTFNALNITDGFSRYISFEKRKSAGTENLYTLLHAIKNQFEIKFSYQKFWEHHVSHRNVQPYALKEFKNRWYIIAKDLKDDGIKCFGLDRLTDVVISRRKFKSPKDYNVEDHFHYCFGIMTADDQEPQEIVLSFNAPQNKYIKSLPLHETQNIIIDHEDELQIKLKLCITHDFMMELLSFGGNMKVLQPLSLAERIKAEHYDAFLRY